MLEELMNIPLFHGVRRDVLSRLVKSKDIDRNTYYKGTTVHGLGTICSCVDVVCSGRLAASALAPNGSESVVFEFGPGSMIGANLLFGNRNRYPMNIDCSANCVLLQVSKPGVEELLKEYSFVMQFVQSLSMNSQGLNQKMAMYTQKSLRENLMEYLMTLAAQQQSNVVVLPTTKKQLADYFGVQRPSLFRELKRMKEEGLITVANRSVAVNFQVRTM